MITGSNDSKTSQICHRNAASFTFRQSLIPNMDKRSARIGLTVGKALASPALLSFIPVA